MDKKAFFTMPSGLYVVSAEFEGLRAGCIVNTAVQVTSQPPRISVAINKENVTSGAVVRAGAFAVTVVDRSADMLYIGNFGFRTSGTFDKFQNYEVRTTALGAPYVPEHAAAVFSCRLVQTVDVGTHLLLVGEVVDADRLGDVAPLTYDYYHRVLKGKTPPRASSYMGVESKEDTMAEEEKKTYKFVCTVCGYEVEVDTPELPEDYVCPVCGVGPDQFELVEE